MFLIHIAVISLVLLSIYLKQFWAIIIASILFVSCGPELGVIGTLFYVLIAAVIAPFLESFFGSFSFKIKIILIVIFFAAFLFIGIKFGKIPFDVSETNNSVVSSTKINFLDLIDMIFILGGWIYLFVNKKNSSEDENTEEKTSLQ